MARDRRRLAVRLRLGDIRQWEVERTTEPPQNLGRRRQVEVAPVLGDGGDEISDGGRSWQRRRL